PHIHALPQRLGLLGVELNLAIDVIAPQLWRVMLIGRADAIPVGFADAVDRERGDAVPANRRMPRLFRQRALLLRLTQSSPPRIAARETPTARSPPRTPTRSEAASAHRTAARARARSRLSPTANAAETA